jgi:hypothetical protein
MKLMKYHFARSNHRLELTARLGWGVSARSLA